jgi:hypothetical protein
MQLKSVVCNTHPFFLPFWYTILPWRHDASRLCLQASLDVARTP